MPRAGLAFVVALAMLGLSACDDNTPTSTPSPTNAFGTAATYLLHSSAVTAYQHGTSSSITAATLADQVGDPALVTQLRDQGYTSGAQIVYNAPTQSDATVPFVAVVSRAYLFGDATGAHAFFVAESERVSQTGAGASISPVSGAPRNNVDDLLALQETIAPDASGALESRAYLGLARRGHVVIELFAQVALAQTTDNDFLPLLAAQEGVLEPHTG